MLVIIIHFTLSLLGTVFIFLFFHCILAKENFSFPFGLISIALSCALLAYYLSAWITPCILVLYALVSAREYYENR
ncbi:MAG: hypothetical protein WAX77_10030 [Methylococcaceae bacterium]